MRAFIDWETINVTATRTHFEFTVLHLWYASNKGGSEVIVFFFFFFFSDGGVQMPRGAHKSAMDSLHTQTVIAQSTSVPADSGSRGYYASV